MPTSTLEWVAAHRVAAAMRRQLPTSIGIAALVGASCVTTALLTATLTRQSGGAVQGPSWLPSVPGRSPSSSSSSSLPSSAPAPSTQSSSLGRTSSVAMTTSEANGGAPAAAAAAAAPAVDVQRQGAEALDTLATWRGKNAPNRPTSHKRILVTGGAGFIGSHLVDRLMEEGNEVIVVDSLFTGKKSNIERWRDHPRFEFFRHDVIEPFTAEVDQIYHLACPASPVHYKYNAIRTLKTGVLGTLNMLGLAKRVGATFLLASTSEVYGDPLAHPQKEEYWGNVNPIGVRSCYDESKRVGETMAFDYHRQHGVDIRVVRIFNTYGPRMVENDGRVVSNFVGQALRGQPLTVYGDGSQTRSFCYVADLVDGIIRMMNSNHTGPFNLGNPGEFSMLELAQLIKDQVDSGRDITYLPATPDDPTKRKPDISKANTHLGWTPAVPLKKGLTSMIADFRERIGEGVTAPPQPPAGA